MFTDKNKETGYKPAGQLKTFLNWPIYVGIVFMGLTVALYLVTPMAGLLAFIFLLLYVAMACVIVFMIKPGIMHELVEFSANYSQVQRQLLYELSVPYCLLDTNGRVLWMNKAMLERTGKHKDFRKNVATIFPEITPNIFPESGEAKEVRISYESRDYCVEMKRISTEVLTQDVNLIEKQDSNSFIALYMFDETDINLYIQKLKDERFVVGLIYIDNYEEALENVDDVRRSLFIGLIDKQVNKYFSAGSALVRKLEKDKYLAVFRYKYLEKLVDDRFSILEDIKNVNIGNEMNVTLSVGIGTGAGDYAQNYDVAKAAMDLALGRGGDQAVVKEGDKIQYYGGKSQQMEKNTRVKVRVKAHALRQILEANDNVLIMGHKMADVDSFGAAVGIYVIARKLGKKANIVINEVTSSVRPFMDRFAGREDYEDDIFLTSDETSAYVNASTVAIVVDVNKPQLTECPPLLERCRTLIVFDHHRSSSEPIGGAVLSYVDPYASSSSEMITEMLQYVDEGIRLKGFEADTLYAGMIIDTDGFNSKAGPRTFEAAAFLRRHGADVTRVRKLLRNDMGEYKAIAEAVSKAEVYKDAFAISIFSGAGVESPTIGGAKAANQLLDISGIKASFVITSYNGKVYISARSIDEVNVQIIMEKLGGGGHISIAGAQLENTTPEQAVVLVKQTLDQMLADGEI